MSEGDIPFLLGVTGHRDLRIEDHAALEARVVELFDALAAQAPTAGLRLLSALAEGADSLVAGLAVARGIPLTAVLPMAADEYVHDFREPAARAEFERLLAAADTVVVAPPVRDDAGRDVPSRDLAYVAAGEIVAAASRLLLALWDGRDSAQLGGTAHVVEMRLHPERNGFDRSHAASGLLGGGDDPLYHLACPRRADGTVAPGLAPLEGRWLLGNLVQPETRGELPEPVLMTLQRLETYALDRRAHAALIADAAPGDLPAMKDDDAAARALRANFHCADMLGRRFKGRITRTLAFLYLLALASAVLFMLYGNFGQRWPIYFVLPVFALGWAAHRIVSRGEWHRRYLHYRLLAEVLRVRYFWHLVGIRRFGPATPHEGFSFELAGGLGWIRNVTAQLTLQSLAQSPRDFEAGLAHARAHWIGDDDRGQLRYFQRATSRHAAFDRRTSRVSGLALACGLVCALALLGAAPLGIGPRAQLWILSAMGLLPLCAGALEAYTLKQADKELVKQFGTMRVLFERARERLDAAGDVRARREVLRELGGICLAETAEWLLVQTERSVDRPKL